MDMWSPWSNASSNRPQHWANERGTSFKNPWPSASAPTWTELAGIQFPLGFYEDLAAKHPETHDVKVAIPDWGASDLKARGLAKDRCIIGTTLGHAGAITEIPLHGSKDKTSFWVVYDPIFSPRAGPTQFTGPQRMRKPPCQVTDLPGTDELRICRSY